MDGWMDIFPRTKNGLNEPQKHVQTWIERDWGEDIDGGANLQVGFL